jgi:hypothetical protein
LLKRTLILYLALFLTGGCSILRKQGDGNMPVLRGITNNIAWKEVVNQNVTDASFFIARADVDITVKGVNDKFIASIKYLVTGEYLISLRSRSGVEGARIFISRDTVLINDRINRKLYFGSGEEMLLRYGVSPSVIPVIFGDYIYSDIEANIVANCVNGEVRSYQTVGEMDVAYILDCGEQKVISARSGNTKSISMKFSNFINLNEKKVAGEIEFEDIARELKLTMRIRKLESPWEGEIDFIPGSGYEHIPLI